MRLTTFPLALLSNSIVNAAGYVNAICSQSFPLALLRGWGFNLKYIQGLIFLWYFSLFQPWFFINHLTTVSTGSNAQIGIIMPNWNNQRNGFTEQSENSELHNISKEVCLCSIWKRCRIKNWSLVSGIVWVNKKLQTDALKCLKIYFICSYIYLMMIFRLLLGMENYY